MSREAKPLKIDFEEVYAETDVLQDGHFRTHAQDVWSRKIDIARQLTEADPSFGMELDDMSPIALSDAVSIEYRSEEYL